jgi:hypothetical protein
MYGVVRLPVTMPVRSLSDWSTTKSFQFSTPYLSVISSRQVVVLTSGVLQM